MHRSIKYMANISVFVFLFVAFFFMWDIESGEESTFSNVSVSTDKHVLENKPEGTDKTKNLPLLDWANRITKKPFGIFVSPGSSPVSPEKFTGYHTGTDFEVFDNELDQRIEVRAICSGNVLISEEISGYGGVTIQECLIADEQVTVLYGHVNISQKDTSRSGEYISKGSKISDLAQAETRYSGGERKHLHLGIHRGREIEYKGYVKRAEELGGWIDFRLLDMNLLK